jgi:prepilin-type processing-associated H-X9-DG protein
LGGAARPWLFGYFYNEGWNENPEWNCNPDAAQCYHGMVSHSAPHPTIAGETVMDVGASDAAVEDPASTIALFDASNNCAQETTSGDAAAFRYPRDTDVLITTRNATPVMSGCFIGTDKRGRVRKRHSEGFNSAFADGHSKWMRKSTPNMWTRYAD